ncbi:spore coat protein [bacterium]|nr:spore coat protein [bacterium]
MKGIILAGGRGTRLNPLTKITSKQLLPVYNKPMVFFPLETLLKSGIKEILIIVSNDRPGDFMRLLGSGKEFGAKFTYEIQDEPKGLPEAFIIGEDFIGDDNVALILGDNIFEEDFSEQIKSFKKGGKIFVKEVQDPERFGVVEIDENNKAISIEEKPKNPKSNLAITGLYIYDNRASSFAKNVKPLFRNETDITEIHKQYMNINELEVEKVKGEWIDAGTFESLYKANSFIRQIELNKKN